MGRFNDLTLRAAGFKPSLGNLLTPAPTSGKGNVTAGTSQITYVGEGQPLAIDWGAEEQARDAYLGSVYTMRCARLIAETIAGLPWVSGIDPTDPADYDKTSALASFLGPSTPQAPGGPNPVTNARALWSWSIIQYLITGRFGWECQLAGPKGKREILGLWPLVSACLSPVPTSHGEPQWFSGYQYTPATGEIDMDLDQVVYCWRPRIDDWRMPESVIEAAAFPVFISRSIQRYIANLLKNNMVASTLVITPPFDEASQRIAWQQQFLSEFTGVDRAGGTIFGEMEADEGDNPNSKPVQVEKLATNVVDASLNIFSANAQNDICIAFGVPRSLIGDASQRTYANADSEYKNFWTLTVLNLISELQDQVNLNLAPRIGDEVGWFDLSRVVALQPPTIFAPPAITDVIATGVADAAQVANVLGIPAANSTGDSDTDTVNIGEESSTPSPSGKASADMSDMELRQWRELEIRRQTERSRRDYAVAQRHPILLRWLEEADRRRNEPVNTWTLQGQRKPWKKLDPERIVLTSTKSLSTRGEGIEKAAAILTHLREVRALASASKLTDEVHGVLSKSYPEKVLGWVKDADWSGPQSVGLNNIDMDRRPGGRDQAKVQGIAKSLVEGDSSGAEAPVVLVRTPGNDKLQIADGYHRTLAHKRIGRDHIDAYVGAVDTDDGPWTGAMHDAKLNRSVELLSTRGFDSWFLAMSPELEASLAYRWEDSPGPYDTSPIGTGKNWVTKTDPATGLGSFVRAVVHALMRAGHPEQEAIQLAEGVMKRWAAGGMHVTPKTIAKAQAAVAHWDALKAAAHAKTALDRSPRLPLLLRAMVASMVESGIEESEATERALRASRGWAAGRGNVEPRTRAKAIQALAEMELEYA